MNIIDRNLGLFDYRMQNNMTELDCITLQAVFKIKKGSVNDIADVFKFGEKSVRNSLRKFYEVGAVAKSERVKNSKGRLTVTYSLTNKGERIVAEMLQLII